MEELLVIKEVAEYFKVTPDTIRKWIKKGKLRAIKVGKNWRVTVKDLERFVESGSSRMDIAENQENTKKKITK
ncbi:MAG: hypothetical protein DDT22_01339 [candidate division WS2 bacterium]|nr:hypothetical protein [Candidatus Lithacetigena glycinireducens]MBT9165327.1 hypothetical protein [Candidatus Lithacetigena glycinireducens]MBT9175655.1 hypothetical protein [Candidatus Lithacetigena glycinireducens]